MPWKSAAYSSPHLNTFWRRGKGGVVLGFFPPTYAFFLDIGILRETEYLFNSRAFLQIQKITMILEYMPWLLGSNYTQPSDLKTRIATLMCPCIFKLPTEFEPYMFSSLCIKAEKGCFKRTLKFKRRLKHIMHDYLLFFQRLQKLEWIIIYLQLYWSYYPSCSLLTPQ